MDLKKFIVDIPNYPEHGVIFRDITSLLNNALAFKTVIKQLAAYAVAQKATVIIAPEARGFLFFGARVLVLVMLPIYGLFLCEKRGNYPEQLLM